MWQACIDELALEESMLYAQYTVAAGAGLEGAGWKTVIIADSYCIMF